MARERRNNSKSAAADRRRPQKKKISILNTEQVEWIDYKDVNLLRRFMSERAKIRARRVTGNSTQQQRHFEILHQFLLLFPKSGQKPPPARINKPCRIVRQTG